MTEAMKDRPASLTRRGPKPAPDEAIDPVDAAPQPTTPTPVAPAAVIAPQNMNTSVRPSKRREVTIPLGTRLSVPVMEVLDQAVLEQGITIRDALEQAIMSRWGND